MPNDDKNIGDNLKDMFQKVTGTVDYTSNFKSKEREENVNLIEILEQNEYCAEFFIMDLWPRFTNDINIGNANLELLAENEPQRQLVFALDNLDLYNVKNKGSALYYKFMLFKNKVKDYVSDIEVEEEYIEENDENGDRDL